MADAALLSLEEFRATQRRVEIRQRRHDRFDQQLDTLEARVQVAQPTLEERTPAGFALRQELTQGATEGVLEQAHRAPLEQRPAGCPPCGQPLWARGPAECTGETLVGALRLRRPSLSGECCRMGIAPVDEARPLRERRKQPDVPKAAVQLPQEIPQATAWELCAELTGLPVSAHTAHAVPPEVAAGVTVLDVAPTRAEIAANLAAGAAGQPWRPSLGRAIEGAAVPPWPETARGRRPGRTPARAKRVRGTGAWRAANGVRFDRIAEDRIGQGLSGHQVQTDEDAAVALRQVQAAGWIAEAQGRRQVMADGARWIWKPAGARFPSAVESLDADHCRAHLSTVAAWPQGAYPERPQAWCEVARARLCWGEGHGVIWGLQRLTPPDAPAAAEIAQLIRYLQRHQTRLDDRVARKGAPPLGVGASPRRIGSSAMGDSSARALGGRCRLLTSCSRDAAHTTTAPSTGSLLATGKGAAKKRCKNLLKHEECTQC